MFEVGLLVRFLVVVTFSFTKRLLRCLLPLPVPTDVCNVILLFTTLRLGIVGIGRVERADDFLVTMVPIVFVPTTIKLVSS